MNYTYFAVLTGSDGCVMRLLSADRSSFKEFYYLAMYGSAELSPEEAEAFYKEFDEMWGLVSNPDYWCNNGEMFTHRYEDCCLYVFKLDTAATKQLDALHQSPAPLNALFASGQVNMTLTGKVTQLGDVVELTGMLMHRQGSGRTPRRGWRGFIDKLFYN